MCDKLCGYGYAQLFGLSITYKPPLPYKMTISSKFLSPPQADVVLRDFAPSGTDFATAWNPRSKLRGIY